MGIGNSRQAGYNESERDKRGGAPNVCHHDFAVPP
jgi:hypothetical protein